MAPITLATVARSDGVLFTAGKGRKQEANGPTADQLQRKAEKNGMDSFYEELPIDHPKNLDWRKKLGAGLLFEITNSARPTTGPASEPGFHVDSHVLVAFPENYRLFEHRRVPKDSSAEEIAEDGKSNKDNRARRDVYLYGHPQGRKKRYRSPADFLPHLIWLVTDQSGDPENCACKLCTSEDSYKAAEDMLKIQRPEAKAGRAEEKAASRQEGTVTQGKSTPSSAAPSTVSSVNTQKRIVSKVSIPVIRRPSDNIPVASPVSTTPIAQPSTVAPPSTSHAHTSSTSSQPPSTPGPIPLVPARSQEQRVDQQVNTFLYRTGELVWYRKLDHNAVALGAIVSRMLYKDVQSKVKAAYVVQPVSHPYNHPTGLITTDESTIQPWLSMTMPACQTMEINSIPFDQIPWDTLVPMSDPGTMIHDGSICASSMVDLSYTLIEPLVAATGPGPIEYNAIFLGSEKIWVGEAIRLGTNAGNEIMILSHIIEDLTRPDPFQVCVVGDVYTLEEKPNNPKRPLPRDHYLPDRLANDLKYRDFHSVSRRQITLKWKFLRGQDRISIADVKGRFYESRLVLDQIRLQDGMAAGIIPDVNAIFNSRAGDTRVVGNRVSDRRQAYGESLPTNLQFDMKFELPRAGSSHGVHFDMSNLPAPETGDTMPDFIDPKQVDQGHFAQNFMG